MNEMEKRRKLVDYINSMDVEEKIALHNSYCDVANCMDDYIYSTEELNEVLEGQTPVDILQRAFYGRFNPNDAFFWFDGYANLESASWADELPIFASDIANYILRKEDSLDNDEIQEILDEDEEDEQLDEDEEDEQED